MPEGLAHPGRLEFQDRLAKRPLAVGIAGLAAGRERDRRGRARGIDVVADAVDVGEAELVGGEFRHRADAERLQPVEHRARLRPQTLGGVEHHALVEGAKQKAVAVALEQFEEPVPEGEIHVRPGAEPVGDEVCEGLVALRQLEIVGRREVERHQHRLTGPSPDRAGPFEHRVAVDRASRRQAEGQGIGDGLGAEDPHEVVVAAALLLARDQRQARHQVLGDLRHRTDDRLVVGGAVADAARHRADEVGIVEEQRDEPARHPGAVEGRERKADDPSRRQHVEIGADGVGQALGQPFDDAGLAEGVGAGCGGSVHDTKTPPRASELV